MGLRKIEKAWKEVGGQGTAKAPGQVLSTLKLKLEGGFFYAKEIPHIWGSQRPPTQSEKKHQQSGKKH